MSRPASRMSARRVPGVDAKVLGPVYSAWASLDIGADGSWGRRPAYPVFTTAPTRSQPPTSGSSSRPRASTRTTLRPRTTNTSPTQRSSRRLRRRRMRPAGLLQEAMGPLGGRSQNSALSRVQAMQPTFTSPWAPVPPRAVVSIRVPRRPLDNSGVARLGAARAPAARLASPSRSIKTPRSDAHGIQRLFPYFCGRDRGAPRSVPELALTSCPWRHR